MQIFSTILACVILFLILLKTFLLFKKDKSNNLVERQTYVNVKIILNSVIILFSLTNIVLNTFLNQNILLYICYIGISFTCVMSIIYSFYEKKRIKEIKKYIENKPIDIVRHRC